MLEQLLLKIQPVHLARTPEERAAIYRFRYSVYTEELKRSIGGVDHATRTVHDADDDASYTYLFYTGSLDNIAGTVRVHVWEPGQIPPHTQEELALHSFPGIERFTAAEIGRFMIRPTARGRFIMPAMAFTVFDFLAGEKRVDLSFSTCRPTLADYYRRLGARFYGAPAFNGGDGVELRMVSVLSDQQHFKQVGSPLARVVKRHFKPGARPPVDTSPFAHLLTGQQPATSQASAVDQELAAGKAQEDVPFLKELSPSAYQAIRRSSLILNVPAGTVLVDVGRVEQELYIITEGTFDVLKNGQTVATMGPGELFGEVAFFHGSGQRSASVKARTAGRVVLLRRKFFDELTDKDPKAAVGILMNLAAVMAKRLA